MERKRDLAIVLRCVPFEERHRVVTALTEEHGRISALARNSIQSRRFGGSLEPFTASEWHFVERLGANLYRVEEAHVRRSFEGIRKDFERLALASVFNELMIKLAPEREPCPELFRLHTNALAILDELSQTPEGLADRSPDLLLLNAYFAKVLQWSGNQPRLHKCLGCATPLQSMQPHQAMSCMIADAGWICPTCRSQETRHIQGREGQGFHQTQLRVTPAALLDFHTSLGSPIRQAIARPAASQQEHRALFTFIEALYVYHVPGFEKEALKSLRFLDLQSNGPRREANLRQNLPFRAEV